MLRMKHNALYETSSRLQDTNSSPALNTEPITSENFWTWEVEAAKSSFIICETINNFFLEFQTVSDADDCKANYYASVDGQTIKQQYITYWHKNDNIKR